MGILIKPIITEKMTPQAEKLNRYGFVVDKGADKLEIKAAVESIFCQKQSPKFFHTSMEKLAAAACACQWQMDP